MQSLDGNRIMIHFINFRQNSVKKKKLYIFKENIIKDE